MTTRKTAGIIGTALATLSVVGNCPGDVGVLRAPGGSGSGISNRINIVKITYQILNDNELTRTRTNNTQVARLTMVWSSSKSQEIYNCNQD